MDETRIGDTNQEDGAVDDIAQLQTQYTLIRTLQSLSASAFSDDDARADHVPPSPTRPPLHLASLSSDQSEFRSELLRSKQETARVLQLNATLQKRVEELESAAVRASTPRSSGGSHTSTPASPANNTPPDQPAGSHLVDPVVSLRQLGDFTDDEARWALFQSNNNVDVAAEILLSGPPVPRIHESQYRPPPVFRRGRGGLRDGVTLTPQPFRSSLSVISVPVRQSVPEVAGSSVYDGQLSSTLGKLTDVIGNLGTFISY
jgi:hypothetical protein